MDFTTKNGKITYHLEVGDRLKLRDTVNTMVLVSFPTSNDPGVGFAKHKKDKPYLFFNPHYLADQIERISELNLE